MSHMIIQVNNDYALALHIEEETLPQLIFIAKETTFDNFRIVNASKDLDIGDLILVKKVMQIQPPVGSAAEALGCCQLAEEASMQEKSRLFTNTLIVIKLISSRRRITGFVLVNAASKEEMKVTVEEAPHLFKENIKVGSQIEVTMNVLEPKARIDPNNRIYIPRGLQTDIVWPLEIKPTATTFVKSYRLCKKEEELSLKLEADNDYGWKKVYKAMLTSVTTAKVDQTRKLEEVQLDNTNIHFEPEDNMIWVWATRENVPNLSFTKGSEKYQHGAIVILSHPTCKSIKIFVDQTNHGNNTICFGARMKCGQLLRSVNLDSVEAIPKSGWNAMIQARLQVPTYFLEGLRKRELPIFDSDANGKEIVKAILGGHTEVASESLEDSIILPELSPMLTDEQKQVIIETFNRLIHTVIVHSPSGSGKSTTLKWLINAMLQTESSFFPILITATTNVAVRHLLSETLKENPGINAVFIPSSHAFKKATQEEAKAGTTHSLRNKLVELLQKGLPEPERTYVSQAVEALDESITGTVAEPDEGEWVDSIDDGDLGNQTTEIIQQAIEILFHYEPPQVIAATTTMASRYIPVLGGIIGSVLVDEASTLRVIDAIQLIGQMSRISKLVLVGDVKQLDTYKGEIPDACIPLGFDGVLSHASLATGAGVSQIHLTRTFRFHPEITKFLSELCYENKLVTSVTEDQRPEMKQLSNRELPILFANVLGRQIPAFPTSKTNPTHTKAAVWLARDAKKKLPECSVTILTFYNGQREDIIQALGEDQIPVCSIDAFQGKESDIVILVTTAVGSFPLKFFDDQQRLTVAFSRSRSGMVVVGHAESLRQLPNWGKFINKLKEKNNIVNLIDLR